MSTPPPRYASAEGAPSLAEEDSSAVGSDATLLAPVGSSAPAGVVGATAATALATAEATAPTVLAAADPNAPTVLAPTGGQPNAEELDEALTDEAPGRYVVRATVGEGGIGRVFLALDRHLGRDVALKELLEGAAEGSGAAEPSGAATTRRSPAERRFVNEARVTGQLEHPGIVPVHELGRRADGTLYYVMRLVRGRTLREALAGRDLRRRLELLPHLVDLCNALGYAHSRGVIHRDIKPDNVMLGDFGETVVLDWGLAKVRGQRDVQSGALARELQRLQSSLPLATVAGMPMGTPSYMPPEQAVGELEEIDERSDVYSLGAVLYELLTGRPPFLGESALEIIRRVVRDEPATPGELEPECPPELAAIAMRALAKDPHERYRDASALAKDVRAFLTGGLVGAHRYGAAALLWRWLRRHRALLLTCAVVVGAASAAWVYRGYDVARQARIEAARREDRLRRDILAQAEELLRATAQGSSEPRWLDTSSYKLISLAEPVARAPLEDRLVAALTDRTVEVRLLAARSLGGMKSVRAVDALCARLTATGTPPVETEPSELARIEVIQALGVIGDGRAEVPVREARYRAGPRSQLWEQTELAYRLIPLAADTASLTSAEQWKERGRALWDKGDGAGALAAFDRAVALDPRMAKAYNNRAIVRETLGDLRGALADYDRSLELEPGVAAVLNNRAGLHRALESYDRALADYERVLASPKLRLLALRNRAMVRREQGDFDGAVNELTRGLAEAPDDPRTLAMLGYTYMQMDRWPAARDTLERALGPSRDYVYALHRHALVEVVLGHPDQALADLDRALSLDPSDDDSRRLRAHLRLAQADEAGATSDLDHCLTGSCTRSVEGLPLRLASRAIVLHGQLGHIDRALADLEQAVERTHSPAERIDFALSGLALAARAGRRTEVDAWRARLDARGAAPWYAALVALVAGSSSHEELAHRAFVPPRRCQLSLAAAVHAELAGDEAAALGYYREGAALPWIDEPSCVTARICARWLRGP